MWQRKQTLFLLLAVATTLCCLSMPIGKFVSETIGEDSLMTNLWIRNAVSVKSYLPLPMFVVLLISSVLTFLTIFLYKNRKLQAKLCAGIIALEMLWVVIYGVIAYWLLDDMGDFSPLYSSCLPVVAIILTWLARVGIIADEKLVRAADRIR